MSTLHTINGEPVVDLDQKTLELIDSFDWDGAKRIRDDAVEVVAVTVQPYRAALREAIAMIEEERTGVKSSYSREDTLKLERLRELAELGDLAPPEAPEVQ